MRPIKASEISTFIYCKRAWWFQHKGTISSNIEELAEGTEFHYKHGRAVFASGFIRIVAYVLVLIALVLFTIYLTNLVL